MVRKFGLTWWGQRWLDSLSGIDYSNRLARGASYARSGRVLDCTIKGNTVQAKVAGHYASAYRVNLTLPEIPKDKVTALANALQQRPALLSKLLNRELSPEVSEIADSLKIQLFPTKWKDLGMSCNCPDGAVPCKHLAAVIYVLCQELDNNPFLIFTLHGVDLLAELQSENTALAAEAVLPTPDVFPDLLAKAELPKNAPTPEPVELQALLSTIDYSVLPSLTELLPSLLQPTPPFYGHGDFREVYQQALDRAALTAERALSERLALERLLPGPNLVGKHSDVQLTLRGDLTVDLTSFSNAAIPLSLAGFLSDLLQLPQETLPHCQPSILALRQCAICALQLIAHGAILPHIVKLDNARIAIRWIPAHLDPSIQDVIQKLSAVLPAGLIRGKKIRKTYALTNAADWIVSLFVSTLLPLLVTPKSDLVSHLFFAAEQFPFDEAGEQEIPGGIKAWTDRLFLEQSRFTPVFIVDETPTEGEFLASLGVIDKESKNPETLPLSKFLSLRKFKDLHVPALRSFAQLSQLVDGLDETIASNGKTPIPLAGENLVHFLLQTVPVIRLLQAQVLLPRSLKDIVRPKPTIRLKQKASAKGKNAHGIRLDELLDFDWQVAIGDDTISVSEFSKLAKNAQGLLYYKGRYIYLTADDIEKLRKSTTRRSTLTPAELLQAALSDEIGRTPIILDPEVRALIKVFTKQDEIPLPDGLHATLRPYQERGFSWLYRNQRIGFGSILADDMGLGKTIQLITLLLKLKQEGALEKRKALIVAPTGLLTNWQAELERFAPSLTHRIYHGPDRHLDPINTDILISSYGIVRSDADEIAQKEWEIIVIDEAQNIKNQNTAQSKAVRNIPATTHIALSGTPVENRLSEFWSIMDFVNRGYLGTDKAFDAEYARPIQNSGDRQLAERFRKITAPFMMRRLKSDKSIISDLPDKLELNRFAQLTPTQASLYQETLKKAMKDIEGIEGQDPQSLFKREGLVLQLILALKQICNHPAQYLKNNDLDPTHSGKTQLLLDLIDSITASNEKALIFTQFREMGTLLQQFIAKRTGEPPMFYHGGTSIKQRNEFIHRFQNNPADQLFILSLKAAGTGLNLTAASHVIHYDLWWNPAVEAQATDRAYRIGQTKNVLVHRFITKDTFEERINRMISEKKALANLTVSSGENWIGKLSNRELRELFG